MMKRVSSANLNNERLLLDSRHDVAPGGIHLAEGTALLWDLLHNLLRTENRLQVEPFALNTQPLFVIMYPLTSKGVGTNTWLMGGALGI